MFNFPAAMKRYPTSMPPIPTGNIWCVWDGTYRTVQADMGWLNLSGVTWWSVPKWIAFDWTDMWVTNDQYSPLNIVSKITPAWTVTPYEIPWLCYWIAFDWSNMWISDYLNNKVNILNSAGSITNTYTLDFVPGDLAWDWNNMWVSILAAPFWIAKITPAWAVTKYTTWTNVTSASQGIAFDGTHMWVTNYYNNSTTKVDIATWSWTEYAWTIATPHKIAWDWDHMWITWDGGFSYVSPTWEISNHAYLFWEGNNRMYWIAWDGARMWFWSVANKWPMYQSTKPPSYPMLGVGISSNVYWMSFDWCLLSHWWGGS